MPKSVYKDNFPDMAKGVRQAIEDRYIEEKTMRGEAGDPNALRLSFEEWKQL
jgi:hypothetical protein